MTDDRAALEATLATYKQGFRHPFSHFVTDIEQLVNMTWRACWTARAAQYARRIAELEQQLNRQIGMTDAAEQVLAAERASRLTAEGSLAEARVLLDDIFSIAAGSNCILHTEQPGMVEIINDVCAFLAHPDGALAAAVLRAATNWGLWYTDRIDGVTDPVTAEPDRQLKAAVDAWRGGQSAE